MSLPRFGPSPRRRAPHNRRNRRPAAVGAAFIAIAGLFLLGFQLSASAKASTAHPDTTSVVSGDITVAPVADCAQLAKMDFRKVVPGSPTTITSATLITNNGASYCDVQGSQPRQLRFDLRLPVSTWTGRYVQEGCGGYCGAVSPGAPAGDGEGTVKFLRGGYGCGKTFMARLAVLDAQAQGFATSFVVVSDNDLKFHRFDDVYRKVLTELGTASAPRGALGDILDRWIGRVEEALIAAGEDDADPAFDAAVAKRLDEDLAAMTGGRAPQDFVRVIQAIFELKQQGSVAEAGALISWLCGSGNVAASVKRAAGIKGDIESRDALDYLRGVLEIVKAAGYKGLVVVIDEAETILRMRSDSRHKSLNGIRQIADASGSYPGMLWVFTGTPEFFDTRQGVAGLAPLHDRIRFLKQGRFASLRQAQLELAPFDAERLRAVALRLRELFPAADHGLLDQKITPAFVERLVTEVTAGFKGDVGVVPRQFLREFVTQLDLVEEHPDYDPMSEYGFQATNLSPEEQHVLSGTALTSPDPDDGAGGLVPAEDVW